MIDFIRREKIYILLVFFILAVNIFNSKSKEEVKNSHIQKEESLSGMTFNEIGLTEQKVRDYIASKEPKARFFRYGIIVGGFIFILAIFLNMAFIFFGRKPVLAIGANKTFVSWGISDILRVCVVVIFLGYVVAIIESFLFKMFQFDIGLNLRMMLNTFIIDIAVGAAVVYFVAVKHGEKIQALGLRFSSCFRDILSGVTAYVFILPLLLIVLLLSIMVLNFFGYTPPPQPVFDVFMEERRSNVLLLLTLFVSVLGPVVEEVFFRGFMYSAIKKRFGVMVAIFLSASIFSLLHTNIVGFLSIMILGVLLAYLYEMTGSLVSSITVHIIHNSIIVGFVFFIKELMT